MHKSLNDPVKPIRNADDHRAALAEIDRLFHAGPDSPEADRLEVLAILAADYERKMGTIPAPDPVELIAFAMDAQGRSQADLARVLGSRSRASEILNRKRCLTADMAAKLAEAWSLPLDILSAPYAVEAPGGGGEKSRGRKAAARAAVALALLLGAASAGVGGLFWTYARDLPGAETLSAHTPPDVRRLDAEGGLAEHRRFVPLAQIPPHVVKAFLAAEDEGFYGHRGYSVWAIARAAVQNASGQTARAAPHGASTITQQFAKNIFLAGEKPSLGRKVKEIVLARRIEAALSKDRILELYLNQIYFGGAAWGVAAAAEQYFGKDVGELTIAEAAYLAGLPKAPNLYRLDDNADPAPARKRRDWVLARMADDGLITAAAARFAQAEPLKAAGREGDDPR